MMKLISSVPALLLYAGSALLTSSHATTTWDATAAFPGPGTNPNGVWSYGYDPASTTGYDFKRFDQFNNDASYPSWIDSNYHTSSTPTIYKNLTSSPLNGLAPGHIALHPGPAAYGDNAILRFTAPATTTSLFDISAQFFAGDSGETEAWIIKNGGFATPLASLGITSLNPSYTTFGLQLASGDTLDFVVGNYGNYAFDTTPLTVVITSRDGAAPEPSTLWLLTGGILVLFCCKRVCEQAG